MNWATLRDPMTWANAIAWGLAYEIVSRLFETYVRPLPIFFDTDSLTWSEEKFGFVAVLLAAGIWLFRKVRKLFDPWGRPVA